MLALKGMCMANMASLTLGGEEPGLPLKNCALGEMSEGTVESLDAFAFEASLLSWPRESESW